MKALIGVFFAIFIETIRNTAAQSQNVPLYFTLSGGDLSLDDISTQITGMETIFNNKKFLVNVELSWDQMEIPIENPSGIIEWDLFIDNEMVHSGSEEYDVLQGLPTSIVAGEGMVDSSGSHVIKVLISMDGMDTPVEKNYQSYYDSASLAPLIVILVLAMVTHMVEFSLGVGIFIGACMISGNIADGFKSTLDVFILNSLADKWHVYVILFGLFISGLVGMTERSGGLKGFSYLMMKYAKTARTAQIMAFISGLIIFFDDYANCLVAGAAMRPVLDSLGVSREKLAFIVDATAAPIASIVPVSSWVGFEINLIQNELDKIAAMVGEDNMTVETSGMAVFLKTIEYRYYPIFMLFLIPLIALTGRDWGPMLIAERKVRVYGRTDGGPGGSHLGKSEFEEKGKNDPSPDTPMYAFNMLVPIAFLVFFIFYLLVQTGKDGSMDQTFMDMIQASDSYAALLWGTMAASIVTMWFYLLQFKQDGKLVCPTCSSLVPSFLTKCINKGDAPKFLVSVGEGMESFIMGMEKIFCAIVILVLAWAGGAVMVAVGLDRYFSEIIVDSGLDYRYLPTISFLVSLLIAFATGTSWGTMTITFPLILVPTYIASDGDPQIFYATTAGLLSGSVAGDHASPISDTTVLSSLASRCGLIEHVMTQAPYTLSVVAWSVAVGTIPIGLEVYSNGAAIGLGAVLALLTCLLLSVNVINSTGRYDILTEIYLLLTKDEVLMKIKEDTATAHSTGTYVDLQLDEISQDELNKFDDSYGSEDPEKEVEMAPSTPSTKKSNDSHSEYTPNIPIHIPSAPTEEET